MKLALPAVLLLLLAGCGGLPGDLRKQISSERDRLQPAEKQVERAEKNVREEFAAGAPTSSEWSRQFRDAKAKLSSARDKSEELRRLEHAGDHESVLRAERLLSDERALRQQATDEADKAEADASRWLDFERNPQHAIAKMQSDYDAVRSVDLASLETKVLKAEQDWPAKKPDLDRRLSSLKQIKEKAALVSPNASPQPAIATLIQNEEELSSDVASLSHDRQQLDAMSGQLYYAWDKILEDLDVTNGVFREKVKTVRTHFIDVADKKTETSSDVQWTDVSAPAYHAVEKDLGMAIAHKDAGLYDSEASSTAQPAGFAYIASPSQGSNQYGYWTHNEGGSFWTFLPQYLIMRELLWGHCISARLRERIQRLLQRLSGRANLLRSDNTGQSAEIRNAGDRHSAALCEQPLCAVRRIQEFGILIAPQRAFCFICSFNSAFDALRQYTSGQRRPPLWPRFGLSIRRPSLRHRRWIRTARALRPPVRRQPQTLGLHLDKAERVVAADVPVDHAETS